MLRNCNASHYVMNKSRMVRIAAEYSLDCLRQLRQDTGIEYEGCEGGTLQLFRDQKQFDNAANNIAVLKQKGLAYELLTADQLKIAESALEHVSHKLTGGLRLPNDETGDCQIFTKKLAKMAQDAGVTFLFNKEIKYLLFEGNKVTGVQCHDGLLIADHYVIAMGAYSTQLLKDKVVIPVYPLKGYSLTIPIIAATRASTSTILEEIYKIAIIRFDERIRVGGMAEVVGFNLAILKLHCNTLKMVIQDLYEGAVTLAKPLFGLV